MQGAAIATFVEYNVRVREGQGEIDVVGLDLKGKKAYVCEVATHLQGLGYKNAQELIVSKFRRAVSYADTHLKTRGFEPNYMFWSPVVLKGKQTETVEEMKRELESEGISIDLVINDSYRQHLEGLHQYGERCNLR